MEDIEHRLRAQARAYKQLKEGADTLLEGKLFFTERALLRLVSFLYDRRLLQLGPWAQESEETAV
jgi:hypothetical protein